MFLEFEYERASVIITSNLQSRSGIPLSLATQR